MIININDTEININENFSNDIKIQTQQLLNSGEEAFCYLVIYNNYKSKNHLKCYFGYKTIIKSNGDLRNFNELLRYRGTNKNIKRIQKCYGNSFLARYIVDIGSYKNMAHLESSVLNDILKNGINKDFFNYSSMGYWDKGGSVLAGLTKDEINKWKKKLSEAKNRPEVKEKQRSNTKRQWKNMSEEQREVFCKKISEKTKAVMNKPEIKEKLSKSLKIAMNRPEVREKLNKSLEIVRSRPEYRCKISESAKRVAKDPTVFKRRSEALKGKNMKNNHASKRAVVIIDGKEIIKNSREEISRFLTKEYNITVQDSIRKWFVIDKKTNKPKISKKWLRRISFAGYFDSDLYKKYKETGIWF